MFQDEQHPDYGDGEKPVSPYRNCSLDVRQVQALIDAEVAGPRVPPVDAEYVVGAASGKLTAERVVTNTATIQWDLATPGQAKANVSALPAYAVDATTLTLDQINVQGASIASAATTDLATATGAYLHITGTTTITAFGTSPAGVSRKLVFDGVLILTHNATSLILPGGADVTTAAGDTAEFISEGSGNWRCFSYQRAAVAP